jgi:kynureninase
MHQSLLSWRSEFPILEKSVYMISNSLGAMPRGARDELVAYADAWAGRGVRAWSEGWWESAVETGNLLAPILGAPKGSVALHPNVSTALSIILSCFEFGSPRDGIVTTDMNFPSVLYVLEQQARRGARVVRVESEDGIGVDPRKLLDAIDETTALVAVSHVLFRSAYIQDAGAVARKARSVGAKVILDVYQSAGCVPVEVGRWGVDFAVGGCLKWLCGGPGTAFLYTRPDLAPDLHPMMTGWQAHARPFDFDAGPMEWGDPRYRLLSGTPNVPAHYAARAGLKIIGEIGVAKIRERSLHLTGILLEEARAAGLHVTCPSDPAARGGTVALDVPGAEDVCRELVARDILVDYRPRAGVRVSPHFYSTDEECRTVVRAAVEILARR